MIFEPNERLWVAYIDTTEAPPVVPDSALAGEPFEVAVTSHTGICGLLRSGAGVEISDGSAIVTPYHVFEELDDHVLCPGVLKEVEHRALVTIASPGEATVTFRGRSRIDDRTVEVVRALTIR